jgi:hypothetical protein
MNGNGIKRRPKHPEWSLVEPKNSVAQVKKVGTKKSNRCPYHNLWSIHPAQEFQKLVAAAPSEGAIVVPDFTGGTM